MLRSALLPECQDAVGALLYPSTNVVVGFHHMVPQNLEPVEVGFVGTLDYQTVEEGLHVFGHAYFYCSVRL
jgi:hypothetical protein